MTVDCEAVNDFLGWTKINAGSEDNCECSGGTNRRGFDGTHLTTLVVAAWLSTA